MRRRLNVKGILLLLGGLVLFGLATHFVHGFQVKRQAGSLLKQAERAENAKEYRLAIDYLRRYLGFRPGETDALARYGRLLAREDIATTPRAGLFAMSILESALRRDPARDEDRRLLVDLGFRLNRHKDVQFHIEYLLGLTEGADTAKQIAQVLKEDSNKSELVGKLALCHEVQRRFPQARTFYELAVRHAPDEVVNYVGLARLLQERTDDVLRTSKDPKTKTKTRETPLLLRTQADELLDSLVKTNPRSSKSYVARAQYRRRYPLRAGREATLEAVERDLELALQLAGVDAEVLLALADLAVDQNRPSQARKFLLQGREKNPGDWRMYQALSRLERSLNRSDDALTHIREGLDKLPERFELLWEHADLLVAIGSDDARAAIDRLKSKGVQQAELDVLSARLLIRMGSKGKWAKPSGCSSTLTPNCSVGRTGSDRPSWRHCWSRATSC